MSVPTPPDDAIASRLAWDEAADLWHDFVASGSDYHRVAFHGPALLDACGSVGGCAVLDLGSGQGYFARLLAEQGARVVGVDQSPRLIAHARRIEGEAPLGLRYEVADAARVVECWAPASFDLATACVALQDFADAPGTLASCHRLLRPGGRLVFSVPHPLLTAAERSWVRRPDGTKGPLLVDHYFATGPRLMRWEMGRLPQPWTTPFQARTIAEWSHLLADAGFLIRRLHEPVPTPEAVGAHPGLDYCRRLPSYLIVDAVRP